MIKLYLSVDTAPKSFVLENDGSGPKGLERTGTRVLLQTYTYVPSCNILLLTNHNNEYFSDNNYFKLEIQIITHSTITHKDWVVNYF